MERTTSFLESSENTNDKMCFRFRSNFSFICL